MTLNEELQLGASVQEPLRHLLRDDFAAPVERGAVIGSSGARSPASVSIASP